MNTPNKVAALSALALLAALALSPAAAEASFEAYGAYGSVSGALVGAAASGGLERIGEVWALRLSGDGEASLSLESGTSAAALALAELSARQGSLFLLVSPEGGLYSEASGLAWKLGSGLSLGVEGVSLSLRAAAHYRLDTGVEGYQEAGLRLGASILSGDGILKPELGLTWRDETAGSSSLSLLPQLGISWYPGLPVSATVEAGYRRSWDRDGTVENSLPTSLALYGAIGQTLLWTAEAAARVGLEVLSLEEASVSAELSFLVARYENSELRLPFGLAWDLDPALGFSLHAGISLALD